MECITTLCLSRRVVSPYVTLGTNARCNVTMVPFGANCAQSGLTDSSATCNSLTRLVG